ncbi:testis development-related protein-like [Scleropages formosus]|uniref:testis development-related protein-like n=1 Tax=Scleropages formosus TaxID=113540 RepID=UPI0008783D94|nr:testis development-related protein-like [Scleropages formosus]
MFRKSRKNRSRALIADGSEEEDEEEEDGGGSHRSPKNKDPDGVEEIASPRSKEIKVKKLKSNRERRDKKLLLADDDEHFLLTGAPTEKGEGSKEEKRSGTYTERGQYLWDSISMSVKQITPSKKAVKVEGWEPPHIREVTGMVDDVTIDAVVRRGTRSSWTGLEEDSSNCANLIETQNPGIRWTSRAKGRLAGMRRRSRGSVSERWEGLK